MIATWFLRDDDTLAGYFPSIGAKSTDAGSEEIYLKCVYDFFLTSLAENPNVPQVLFTNADTLMIGEQNLTKTLTDWGVKVIVLPMTYGVPSSWRQTFRNQFYRYDVVDYFAKTPPEDGWMILADSDCVWVRSSDRIEASAREDGLATIIIPYAQDYAINGLSAAGIQKVMPELGLRTIDNVPAYCGGEVMALSNEYCQIVSGMARTLFDAIMAKHQLEPSFECEEAHMLSMIVAHLGVKPGTMDRSIKRLWTGRQTQNGVPADMDLDLWHVPAEKRFGLARIYRMWSGKPQLWARIPQVDRRRILAAILGIPKPSLMKQLNDESVRVRYTLRKLLRRSARGS